jgi:ribose-phosphate pyrophosphokinase
MSSMPPRESALSVLALHSSHALGLSICGHLGVPLAPHEEREFEDGEHKSRPLESVRGRDVYVVASLHGGAGQSANDRLCRLLFFLGALRDAGAARLTAVVPYLCYARKDRRTKPRDPVTTRYLAALFEAVGIDRIMTLDVHNPAAYENAFRVPAEQLEARPLLIDYFVPKIADQPVVVVAPDAGGTKRAERFRQGLERRLGRPVGAAFAEKHRSEGKVAGQLFAGEVMGHVAIIVDDLIASGGTLARVAEACRARGARAVYAAAAHGAFVGEANRILAGSSLDQVVITNSVDPLNVAPELLGSKVVTVDIAPLLGAAIARLNGNGSLVEIIES